MHMENGKLFARTEKELETLIQAVQIYGQDIGIEFDIEKWTLEEKETYKYLGILEADTIKHDEMKKKVKKEYLRRTRKLLETKLFCRNHIKGINTWAVSLVRYSGPFLK